ncbi:MAG: serine hydrolase [Gemmatimonadota bacterium]|nr:MAG: serine hydrolase [Gemmatimonadota bacterium]
MRNEPAGALSRLGSSCYYVAQLTAIPLLLVIALSSTLREHGRTTRNKIIAWCCLLFLPLATLALSCETPTDLQQSYRVPIQTNDGWTTATVESVGMQRDPLESMLGLIAATGDHMIHSILIVRNQRLVFEEYWDGMDLDIARGLDPITTEFDRETLHYMASVSKSVTSALVGIAIDQGLIAGVADPVFSFFPDYQDLNNSDKAQITLHHMLAMCSGYDWNEFEYGFDDPRDSHYQMFNTSDPLRFLLGRPVVAVPGTEFLYNSGDTNILGEVVRRTSASSYLADFAEAHLFGPLGIDSYRWTRLTLADSITFASGGLYLRPRDMAKFGALYLNDGSWNGEQIISTSWIDASRDMAISLVGDYGTLYGYGYQFWLGCLRYRQTTIDYYRAAGWGGQYIYIMPDLDMVIVFTAGGYYDTRPLNFNTIIEDYIFAAVID